MNIGNFDTNKKIFIVAEIGNNHEGNLSNAKKMIDLAHKAGANAVKFQTFKVEKFVYKKNLARFNQLKKFQLSYKEFKELKEYTKKRKMIFFSTPLDLDSADFLCKFTPVIKISSGDNNFYELIKKVIKSKKPLILSTGLMSTSNIKKILNFIQKNLNKNYLKKKVAILHCVTSYPVPSKYANIRSVSYIKNKFKITTGYSDHTIGIDACIASASLGARIIEKHFTLNKKHSKFRDHALSADYFDFKKMVKSIRNIEILLGKYSKDIQKIEKPFLKSARRAIYSATDLKNNSLISNNNIDFLRPGPTEIKLSFDNIKGKKTKKFIKSGNLIKPKNLV